MVLEQLDIHMQKKIKNKPRHRLTPITNINSNRSKGLNVKFKPIDVRFLKDNVGRNLDDPVLVFKYNTNDN